MKAKHADWFETTVKYDKIGEDGLPVKSKESYAIEVFNFTEAESTITEEMKSYIRGEFIVQDIKKAPYKEVFFSENSNDDKFYKIKIQYIIINEKTETENYSSCTYLVQSNNLQNAVKSICKELDKGMQDWKIASVSETKLLDVFEKTKIEE